MLSSIFYLNCLENSIFNRRGVRLYFFSPYFIEIPVFNANCVGPDQTPHCAASDLGIHCLPMLLLWDARLKWVNVKSGVTRKNFEIF